MSRSRRANQVALLARYRLSVCGSALMAMLLVGSLPTRASDQTTTFRLPPVRIPLELKDQKVTIAASALITLSRKERGLDILRLELSADLSDLQQNLTAVLSSELNKNDRCGDRIQIQHATLEPLDPASLATVQLHYERWACIKVFGKPEVKRLTGGNAIMQMKLTPAIGENNTDLELVPSVGSIEADGSLGQLLRSGSLGGLLREKIRKAVLSALQKGTDLKATLPSAIQGYGTIQNAEFKNQGSGRLVVLLVGEFRINDEQLQSLAKEVKARVASR
jgi:hypothetical protein